MRMRSPLFKKGMVGRPLLLHFYKIVKGIDSETHI